MAMKQLKNKRALVTGVASGIGQAIAIALADQGTHLVLIDIDGDGLAKTAAATRQRGVETVTFQCDLADMKHVEACAEATLAGGHSLDILINNAGIAYYGPTEEMTNAQWAHVLNLNLQAPTQLIRAFLPTLKSRDESHILNVVSVGGLVAGSKMAAYNTTKFALLGLSESLRAELRGDGVGVSAICPGFTKTAIFDNSHNQQGGRGIRRPPAWMMTTPEAVAYAAVKAIRRNDPLVVITPLAKVLWLLKRMAPRTFARALGWRFNRPKSARRIALREQPHSRSEKKAA